MPWRSRPASLAAKPAQQPVTIQLLNVSDWHGNIDPVATAGGAWNISARWKQDRLAYPSISLTAGDDFGASPPLASFFDEVPAVKTERLMGIQVNTFGNHDFDKGIDHLQSMIDLAAAPTSAENPGNPFPYVAANLANLDANLTGVEPFKTINIAKLKVAFIGIVNEEAPTIVSPGNFGTIEITDGVAAATKAAQKAAADGRERRRRLDPQGHGHRVSADRQAQGLRRGPAGWPGGRRHRRPHRTSSSRALPPTGCCTTRTPATGTRTRRR